MYKFFNILIIGIIFLFSNVSHGERVRVYIDRYSQNMLDFILYNRQYYQGVNLVNFISSEFLGNHYEANTLSSYDDNFEVLVVKFDGLDCFTYIDYIEALKGSFTFDDFIKNLIAVRYIGSDVEYLKRRHFFTDWYATWVPNGIDITGKISPYYEVVDKELNLKADGSEYIPHLGIINRRIKYIPSDKVDDLVISNMRTGDYVGIYSNLVGLDVSHVGIFIRDEKGGGIYRNASSLSKNMKVVDTPLLNYIKGKPGIVVIRPLR